MLENINKVTPTSNIHADSLMRLPSPNIDRHFSHILVPIWSILQLIFKHCCCLNWRALSHKWCIRPILYQKWNQIHNCNQTYNITELIIASNGIRFKKVFRYISLTFRQSVETFNDIILIRYRIILNLYPKQKQIYSCAKYV